ncbi:hypothetical protein Z043_122964, partial [Scleropages formosus]
MSSIGRWQLHFPSADLQQRLRHKADYMTYGRGQQRTCFGVKLDRGSVFSSFSVRFLHCRAQPCRAEQGRSGTVPSSENLERNKDSVILWYFRSGVDDLIAQFIKGETETDFDERFRDRLELDTQTGSLTIRNLNTKAAPKPEIRHVRRRREATDRELVSKPRTRTRQQDTEVQSSSCRLLCSVENDRDVTLSWTRGKEMLNQTSSPHLNTTLSLHLDIEEQDNDTYSCVSSNPVSEESLQVNVTICWE